MSNGHDIVVIGASAGGVEALSELVAGLPRDLPAAVFIVLHTSPAFRSLLPEVLAQHGPMPAALGVHGEAIVPSRIYVAPPDNHLMLRSGYLHVARGPKENGHRPAVDALFRSASKVYGPRVIGVLLTGYLDCGTAGLLSIKARGGKVIVQDPADAAVPDMPASAIKHVAVDHISRMQELPALITRLVSEPAEHWPARLPGALAELEGDELGVASDIVCPLCQGKLTETAFQGFASYRCHVGHSFTRESITAEQADAIERALWAGVRALDEGAKLATRFASGATGDVQRRLIEKGEVQTQQAQVIRRFLLEGDGLSITDARATATATDARAPGPSKPS